LFALTILCSLFWTQNIFAYGNWNACGNCHGGFNGGNYTSLSPDDPASWGMNLMNGHISRFNLSCSDCHSAGSFSPVILNSSSSGITCSSCHGREEDNGGNGTLGPLPSAGLRQRHFNAGVTTCGTCHGPDSNPNFYTPAAENISPPTFITKGIDPCNDVAFGASGLDNDGDGQRDGADTDCQAADLPPVAVINADANGTVGAPLTFDGSASTDDGSIVSYDWAFGDGISASGMTVNHTYSSPGNYTVSLDVCDDASPSQCNSATHMVNITAAPVDMPPTAIITGPNTGLAGDSLIFDGSTSTDDGTIVSYAWDVDGVSAGSGTSLNYTFASAGSYVVGLTVCDDASPSQCNTATHVVTIQDTMVDNPPTAVITGPTSGTAGDTLSFDGSGSSDDGSIISYAWTVDSMSAGSGMSLNYTFTTAGSYTVVLTVCDNASPSQCNSTNQGVTISPVVTGDGESLYLNNCAFCHGNATTPDPAPAAGIKVAGARSCSIQGAIYGTSIYPDGVMDMRFLQGMLTQDQVAQIADYLNSFAVTGEQRYLTACSGCHGSDGSGGPTNEDVRGENAGDIQEAIQDEREMHFLNCLPDSDLAQIGNFLTASNDGGNDQDGHDREHDYKYDRDHDDGDNDRYRQHRGSRFDNVSDRYRRLRFRHYRDHD
jgi:PKD repeat protein